jgi:hypothetical protein
MNKALKSYRAWHSWNFNRTPEIIRRVEKSLSEAFNNTEKRTFDIWLDMPNNGPSTNIVEHHFE